MRSIYIWMGGIVMLSASLSYGHGVNYGIFKEPTMAVQFSYAGGEPMSYIQTKIFGPQSSVDLEYQNGRTDARGVFAFVPDRPGAWRVEAWDDSGHKGRVEIEVVKNDTGLEATTQAKSIQDGSTMTKILLGLSLIANLALVVAFTRGRMRS